MKSQFRSPLLALVGWALVPLSAGACDCQYAGAPCKAFANTPTVFVGRVTRIAPINLKMATGNDYKDRLVSFDVGRSYRGLTTKTAEVLSTGSFAHSRHKGFTIVTTSSAEAGQRITYKFDGSFYRAKP